MKRITVNGTMHAFRRGGGLMLGMKVGYPCAVVGDQDLCEHAYYMWTVAVMLIIGTISFHIKTRKVRR